MKQDAKDRLNRLLALVPYLLAHPGVKKRDVSELFGVDLTTLEADLETLWYCGLPPYDPLALIDVEQEGEEITLSSADYFSRPLRLTAAEGEALISALSVLGPSDPALASSLEKIETAMGSRRRESAAMIMQPASKCAVLDELVEAMAGSRVVEIKYYSASRDETGERRIHPYRLLSLEGNWYALAHCEQARQTRLFRLDRILKTNLTKERFDMPAGVSTEEYEAGKAFGGNGAGKRALVRFSESVRRWAREAWPEHEHKAKGQEGIFEIPYSREPWMVRQLLPYATEATVLGPEELVRAMKSTLCELRDRYV